MLPAKLNQWLSTNGLKIEISLVVLILITVLLKNIGYQDVVSVLMILMFTLAAYYFLSAYIPMDVKGVFGTMIVKICSISSTVCVIGLLYAILHWPGALEMLLIGSFSATVAGLILLVFWLKTRSTNILPLLIRSVVVGGTAISAYLALSNIEGH